MNKGQKKHFGQSRKCKEGKTFCNISKKWTFPLFKSNVTVNEFVFFCWMNVDQKMLSTSSMLRLSKTRKTEREGEGERVREREGGREREREWANALLCIYLSLVGA